MEMEGQILGNRYELIERIGGGGMALVYKAKCHLLNRFVAIKILRSEFANDDEFVKRFRIEAQSAASLSHPNIVSIYDVGQEYNMHYIVMEYVDGITLKDYIDEKRVLGWKEAVNIAIMVCSAMEHAHRNRIVHRDIKPHNILMTKDGIAKVTDFGIARAVSASTITMVGSTIGSVHYFSPEQARGGFTDEKSDLYSLGITLYEMVTGRLPFDGETPVAVAMKHLQEEAEPPSVLDETIPKGVNDIIMKAIKKDQNKRYQTASDALKDLHKVLREPDAEIAGVDDDDVEGFATRKFKAVSEVDLPQEDSRAIRLKGEKDVKDPEKDKKKDKMTIRLAVATSVILILIFSFIGYKIVSPMVTTSETTEYALKNYVGENIDQVKAELENEKFKVTVNRVDDESTSKDVITKQNVSPGTKFKVDGVREITLTVSNGPKMIKIPDLKNRDYRTAEGELHSLGLAYKTLEEPSDTVAKDNVTRTDPDANEEVKPDSSVTIYKSTGKQVKATEVPDLMGQTRVKAQKLLSDAKLVIGNPSTGNGSDKVIKQDPAPKTQVNEGSAVNVYFEGGSLNLTYKLTWIDLDKPDNYGDTIKVRVETKLPNSNKFESILDKEKQKSDFPLSVAIPVADSGSTEVRVYIDNNLINEFSEKP